MKVAASDGVKVYNVSSGKSVPEWLSEGKKRSLRKDEEYRRRLELIQDFEFPAAAHRIKATPDGRYIYASGIHPPRVRCFDVSQLSMKFERHLDSEIVDFQILSDDYAKLAFLCADRSVAFHAKFGAYHRVRVPRAGRALAYAPHTADLLVAGSADEIYRLNLEEGRFQTPLASRSPGVNRLAASPLHGLVAAAGEGGLLECFDPRQERCAGRLDAAAAAGAAGEALTAVAFDGRGLQCAVGTGNGLVALFDLRSPRPALVKDHMYGAPIHSLAFHEPVADGGLATRRVVSADRHIVRVWDADSGRGFTSVQPPSGAINDVLLWPNSGLLLLACDAPKLQAYFVPALGPSPAWCSFLEGLTEELEESAAPAVYDDYRFVTRGELESLGMSHLIGTALLRAYMHGFFMHNRLWQKARAIARPTDLATVRRERVAARLEAERQSRISLKRRLPKVNAGLAARLLEEQAAGAPDAAAAADAEGRERKRARAPAGESLLADERFQAMFADPAFAIDEQAEEYRQLHPNAARSRDKRLVAEHFAEAESDGQQASAGSSDGGSDSHSASEGPGGGRQQEARRQPREGAKQAGAPRMLAARSQAAADAFLRQESLAAARSMPLGERPERQAPIERKGGRVGGQREVTFFPRGRGRGSGRGGGRGRDAGGNRDPGGQRGPFRERAADSGRGGRGRGRSASWGRGGRGGSSGRGRGRGRR